MKTRTRAHSCSSICNQEIKAAEQARLQRVTLGVRAGRAQKAPASASPAREGGSAQGWTAQDRSQPAAVQRKQLELEDTHVLVAHVPVRPLSVGHHLPHDDAVAPHVTGGGEFPKGDGFWCRPPDGDLPPLLTHTHRQKEGEGLPLAHRLVPRKRMSQCKFHRHGKY